METSKPAHGPRHYIRRRGRMTQGQSRALVECADRAALLGDGDARERLQQLRPWSDIFAAQIQAQADLNEDGLNNDELNQAGLNLGVEIGFGMGQALVDWGEQQPEMALVGIEVYQPGIGSLLLQLQQAQRLHQYYVLEADAREAFALAFAADSLNEVRIFFPDPWHKARHNKRRLVQRDFLALVADRLKPGGVLRMATDWEDYAQWMKIEVEATPGLVNANPGGGFAPRFAQRNTTRFEARGQRLGHQTWDLHYLAP